jgi:hypothetical protein
VLLSVGGLAAAELTSACPPGGPLAFGSCSGVRPLAVGVTLLAGGLYVAGLSGVLAWTAGLQRRGVADARAARDWYVLAAVLGLLAAPLLAFSLVSAFR